MSRACPGARRKRAGRYDRRVGRREDNKAAKRRRIDEAGARELLGAGYAAATVDRVVAEADVARGTFYLYYADKHALFEELVARFWAPLLLAVTRARDALAAGAEPVPVYVQLGADLAACLADQPDGARLSLREARAAGPGGDVVRAHSRQVEALTEEILADAVRRGLLRPHLTRPVALAIAGGVERLTWAWLDGEAPLDPAAITAELIGLFTWGLAAAR